MLFRSMSGYAGEPLMLTGEAAEETGLRHGLRVAPSPWRMPRASILGLLAETIEGVDPKIVVPNYIRSSSAKPRKNGE